jgi:pimeloyl-ACP methyl ester carboxylesterase
MSVALAIRRWHIVIGGFRQTEGKPTGMVRLWHRLHELHAQPGVCVELRSWNDNWRELAELIWRVQPEDEPVVIKVYAYSWGAGWGAMRLARELSRRGVNVSWMVLSDPVYRSPWIITRWLALVPWRSILVPPNVRVVHWFRQRVSLPSGHALRPQRKERTVISPAVWADVSHLYMDDLRTFHRECERVSAL